MRPTRASSGSAATPAPPMRLAWISVRREIRRLPFASPSGRAARSRAGVAATPPGGGGEGVVPGRRGAVPGGAGVFPGLAGRGGAPAGAAVPPLAGRGGAAVLPLAGRGGAPAGASVPPLAGRVWPVPGWRGEFPPWAGRDDAPSAGIPPRRGGAPAGEACGAVPACGRREVPVPCADRDGGPDGVARGVPPFRVTRFGEPSLPARGAVPGSPGRCGLVRACPVGVPDAAGPFLDFGR